MVDTNTGLEDSPFQIMKKNGSFNITPCESIVNFDDESKFTKLKLSTSQKLHMSALLQQVPSMMATGAMAQAYIVKFPNGIPHTLTALEQGGFYNMVQQNGRFVGAAPLYPITAQAAVLGAFTAMSVASGQYFLAQINKELNMIKLNVDKILEFLYGDKKAELLSEISFAKYAYQNYASIMEHESQKTATIGSLQACKKIAMKDIEFYMSDLDATVNFKDNSNIISIVNKSFQIKESLELSIQLCVMSCLMEVYYSQNYDSNYIKYIESDMSTYIDKCEKRMLSSFSVLNRRISDHKGKMWEKIDTSSHEKRAAEVVELLNSGGESDIRKSLRLALYAVVQKTAYYVSNTGDVYLNVK